MLPVIKINNLSKQYRLGTVGTGTLSNDLKRWWHRARGKEDPFLKVGETNDRSIKGDSNYVWALKDINLQVMPGEVLGIIGKNGAGKSTLLKILSKVTGPTTGKISFNELYTLYQKCDIFLVLSEHEGFCIPVLEAQYNSLPVIALARCAVPDTAGTDQLMYNEPDYLWFASAIKTISENAGYRKKLIDAGKRNVLKYKKDLITEALCKVIERYL